MLCQDQTQGISRFFPDLLGCSYTKDKDVSGLKTKEPDVRGGGMIFPQR